MIMTTTTTVTTTTTATTSCLSAAQSTISLSSVLYVNQSSAKGKNNEPLSSLKSLIESPDNSITIKAEVYSPPDKYFHSTQRVISTRDQMLSEPISKYIAASDGVEAIELMPLLASSSAEQVAESSAHIISSDTSKLVIRNRESSLTEFLYPDEEFINAFPTVSIQPIPDTGVLMLDVTKHALRPDVFCVSSKPNKCFVCKKEMTVHFSYQDQGFSYIYDLEKKKEIVQPYKINNNVQLRHNVCIRERQKKGHNYFFRIFEEKSHHFQRWRSIEWLYLIKIIFVVITTLAILGIVIYLTLLGYTFQILGSLWIFIIFMVLLVVFMVQIWGRLFIEHCRQWSKNDRSLKLVIWKPSSVPTLEPVIISTTV